MLKKVAGGGGGGGGGVPGLVEPSAGWDSLEAMLREQQTDEERAFRSDLAAGRGVLSPMASLRLFDAPDGYEPRVTLYRDGSSWCPYCQKVWMQLEEKRIPYKVVRVRCPTNSGV